MIYSNFGCHLEIIGNCGKPKVKGYRYAPQLVRAIRQDDKAVRHYFLHTLRAEGGIDALEAAVAMAPEIILTGAKLKAAILQAS